MEGVQPSSGSRKARTRSTGHAFDALTPVHWTDGHVSPCHRFRNNAVRPQLHALAYNLGNVLRTLALPQEVEHWSMTTLHNKLIEIGAKVVRTWPLLHSPACRGQLAEIAIPRALFARILRLIDRLRPASLPP